MKTPLSNYDSNTNFWNVNKEFKVFKTFKELFDKDKSKDKIASSNLMWALAHLYEREGNRLIKMSVDDRKQIIAEDILGDPQFNWEKYQKLMDYYNNTCIDSLDRTISSLEDKLDERNKFLIDTKYNLQTAKILDDIFASTAKIQALLDEMKAKRDKDLSGGEQTKGGFTESASEKGVI